VSQVASLRRASWWRSKLWGSVFGVFSRGITTFETRNDAASKTRNYAASAKPLSQKVRLPDGPLIVVANHTSHADSAALVALIGRVRPVLVVSAKDYWKQDATAEWLSAGLIGTWPVSREGHGFDELRAVEPLVRDGAVLVVFSEGKRSLDGKLQEFHSGAFRLAAEIGARILPVGIRGNFEGLPKGSTWPKRLPVNIRLGEPIEVPADDVDAAVAKAHRQVAQLTAEPAIDLPQFGWSRISRLAFGPVGLAVIFFWAFGEGVFWPLIAEMPLMLFIVTVGWRWRGLLLVAVACVGSALGVLTTWWLVSHGITPPSPLTTARMFEVARGQLEADPASAFWRQMFNGIPVKVYAHEAGALQLGFAQVLLSLVPRVLRIAVIGVGTWLLGSALSRWLKSCLGMVQGICLALFPFGLFLTVGYWS
jgi:1-acyl-sn-glycerol-3-phosphate acyltransferase